MQITDWEKIVNSYGTVVWRTVYRLLNNQDDAADCFQETFASALEVAKRQRVRNFSALLIRLATMRAIDRLRQRNTYSHRNSSSTDISSIESDNPSPDNQLQRQELAVSLREAIAKLPAQEAEVFCLRHLSNMSYHRIGKELGIKTGTAGAILHRAKNKLRQWLEPSAEKMGDSVL